VLSVEPADGFLDVTVRSPDGVSVYRARNVVFATGLRPHLPTGVVPSRRIWHNRVLLERAGELESGRFVVVGAGQSAAEVVAFLHERFPAAEVCAVFSRYGYSPADDSAFANRIFDPAAVDAFYDAPGDVKQSLVDYHANTNYSVVDIDLIDELYRRVYREKVLGAQRLRLFNVSRVADTVETASGVRTTVESLATGERTVLDADAVIYATGYRPADPGPLLASCPCDRDEAGRLRVGRDYRVMTDPALGPGIYLQGGTEHTHGITSSLLSNTAIRAAEILASIVGAGVPAPQFTTA
jgi:L-ornithine N5-oxygenase